MSSDVEYLLLKDKGPYHEVCVRRRLNTNPGMCKFYTTVSCIISFSLLVLLGSLVYVFVLVPSWQGRVLTWDGRTLQEAGEHVLAHTRCGPVEGAQDQGVYVFRGIPYALPPTGRRRWTRPEGLSPGKGTCWSGTRQARRFGSECVQPAGFTGNYTRFTGREDCLYLNVWSPSLDPLARRPVMLWIHGGDLVLGSGNMAFMSPSIDVVKATGAVYVSINYRLGPLGFLALDMRSEDPSSEVLSGNYGLMDMIVALTWVRDNIRNFGGDASKVTVFGQSSGGTAIHALLASPLASGLFQRAWLASPSAILNKTLAEASRDNRVFLKRTGCGDVGCLRGLSAERLMAATPWEVFPYWGMESLFHMPVRGRFVGALPVVDGYVLKEAPLQAWVNGRGNDVPTMFTTAAQEVDLMPFDPTISSWPWPHYTATVQEQLSPFSPRIAQRALELYPAAGSFAQSVGSQGQGHQSTGPQGQGHQSSRSQFTPEYQYTSLVSDIRANCPVNVLANVTARHFRSGVYRGVTTAFPSRAVNLFNVSSARYAFHGWDLVVFFGRFADFRFQPAQSDLHFQTLLRQQMMTFARDGRPEAPVWDTARTCTALLSDHVFPVERYNKERCDFWLGNGFFSYAWIN